MDCTFSGLYGSLLQRGVVEHRARSWMSGWVDGRVVRTEWPANWKLTIRSLQLMQSWIGRLDADCLAERVTGWDRTFSIRRTGLTGNRIDAVLVMLSLERVSCIKTVLRHILDVLVLWIGVSVLVLTSLSSASSKKMSDVGDANAFPMQWWRQLYGTCDE